MKYNYMTMKSLVLMVALFCFCHSFAAVNTLWYVNDDASGNNDGTSWTDAFTDLQSAIAAAGNTDTIVVAAGTYTPHASNRSTYFEFSSGEQVKLFGGFAGTEVNFDQTALDARDLMTNETVLSGDLNGDDVGFTNNGENSYHVVLVSATSTSISSNLEIDGFTISGGNADYMPTPGVIEDEGLGGGMLVIANSTSTRLCNPTVRNIVFKNNAAVNGGGLANHAINAGAKVNATYENLLFEGNRVSSVHSSVAVWGGGLYNIAVQGNIASTFEEVEFRENYAIGTNGRGGAIANSATEYFNSPASSNSTFTGLVLCSNYAGDDASAIFNKVQESNTGMAECSPIFVNTTIAASNTGTSWAVLNDNTQNGTCNPQFINTIIATDAFTEVYNLSLGTAPNPTYTNCLIDGSGGSSSWNTSLGTDGGGNIDGAVQFVDTFMCDVSVYTSSPVIGAGNGAYGINIGYYQGIGVVPPLSIVGMVNDLTAVCSGDYDATTITVSDAEVDSVMFTATSSADSVVSASNIMISDTGATRLITVMAGNSAGTATITVEATNGMDTVSTTFDVTVNAVPGFDSVAINSANQTYCISLAGGDIGVLSNLTYEVDGSSSSVNQFCSLSPGAHYGIISTSTCVSDTLYFDLDSIPVLALSDIDSTFILCQGDSVYNIPITITDADPSTVFLTGGSDNVSVIGNSSFSFSGTGANRTVTIKANQLSTGVVNAYVRATNQYGTQVYSYFVVAVGQAPPLTSYNEGPGQNNDWCLSVNLTFGSAVYSIDSITWINGDNQVQWCGLSNQTYTVYAVDTLTGCYSVDEYTITNAPIGLEESQLVEQVNIYPNPNSGLFTIDFGSLENIERITMVDLVGKVVWEQTMQANAGIHQMDASMLNKGVYYFNVFANGNMLTKKVLIQ